MGRDFDFIVCYWSVDVYYFHCGHRKCATERPCAVNQLMVEILTRYSGSILVASDDMMRQQRLLDDLEP
jgi:hypothetical protein